MGNNSTAVTSPHIINYPRPPRNNTGKWQALGSIIGALIGRLANSDKLDDASDAEDTWADINSQLHGRGNVLFAYATDERARAALLDPCLNELHTKLCCLALTGYIPDYNGIMLRAKADVETVVNTKIQEICRQATRYNRNVTTETYCDIQRAGVLALVQSVTGARERERQFAYQQQTEFTYKVAALVESHRQSRTNSSLQFDTTGGQFLSSAGRNYAYLAESLRRSAQLDGGSFATLGAVGALFLSQYFNNSCDGVDATDNCGCQKTQFCIDNPTNACCVADPTNTACV